MSSTNLSGGTSSSNASWKSNTITVSDTDYQVGRLEDYVIVKTSQTITMPATPLIGRRVVVLANGGDALCAGGEFPIQGGDFTIPDESIFWFIFSGSSWFAAGE